MPTGQRRAEGQAWYRWRGRGQQPAVSCVERGQQGGWVGCARAEALLGDEAGVDLVQLFWREDQPVHLAVAWLAGEGHFANEDGVVLLLLFGLGEEQQARVRGRARGTEAPFSPPPSWPRPSPSGRGQMGKCQSQWGRWLQGAAGPSPSSLHPARGKEASPYHPPAQAACAQLPPGACSDQDWPQHSLSPERQSRQAARPRAAPGERRPSERASVTAFSSSGPLRLGPGLCPSSQKSYLQPLDGIAH